MQQALYRRISSGSATSKSNASLQAGHTAAHSRYSSASGAASFQEVDADRPIRLELRFQDMPGQNHAPEIANMHSLATSVSDAVPPSAPASASEASGATALEHLQVALRMRTRAQSAAEARTKSLEHALALTKQQLEGVRARLAKQEAWQADHKQPMMLDVELVTVGCRPGSSRSRAGTGGGGPANSSTGGAAPADVTTASIDPPSTPMEVAGAAPKAETAAEFVGEVEDEAVASRVALLGADLEALQRAVASDTPVVLCLKTASHPLMLEWHHQTCEDEATGVVASAPAEQTAVSVQKRTCMQSVEGDSSQQPAEPTTQSFAVLEAAVQQAQMPMEQPLLDATVPQHGWICVPSMSAPLGRALVPWSQPANSFVVVSIGEALRHQVGGFQAAAATSLDPGDGMTAQRSLPGPESSVLESEPVTSPAASTVPSTRPQLAGCAASRGAQVVVLVPELQAQLSRVPQLEQQVSDLQSQLVSTQRALLASNAAQEHHAQQPMPSPLRSYMLPPLAPTPLATPMAAPNSSTTVDVHGSVPIAAPTIASRLVELPFLNSPIPNSLAQGVDCDHRNFTTACPDVGSNVIFPHLPSHAVDKDSTIGTPIATRADRGPSSMPHINGHAADAFSPTPGSWAWDTSPLRAPSEADSVSSHMMDR